jgi:hypothetical protein
MIYTIGIRMKYERALAAGPVLKRGRGKNPDGTLYPGGFAFATAEDAKRFLASKGLTATHMVMGVNADWDRDTEIHDGKPYRHLIRDTDVVKLD